MDEMSVEKWWNEICGRGKWEKPREKRTQTPFHPPRNPQIEYDVIFIVNMAYEKLLLISPIDNYVGL